MQAKRNVDSGRALMTEEVARTKRDAAEKDEQVLALQRRCVDEKRQKEALQKEVDRLKVGRTGRRADLTREVGKVGREMRREWKEGQEGGGAAAAMCGREAAEGGSAEGGGQAQDGQGWEDGRGNGGGRGWSGGLLIRGGTSRLYRSLWTSSRWACGGRLGVGGGRGKGRG